MTVWRRNFLRYGSIHQYRIPFLSPISTATAFLNLVSMRTGWCDSLNEHRRRPNLRLRGEFLRYRFQPGLSKFNGIPSRRLSNHKVYRDTIPQPQSFLATVTGTSFIDTTVVAGRTYWYAVTLVNPTESDHSISVSTMAHNPARVDSVAQQTLSQISLWLSVPVDQNRLSVAEIFVDDSVKPTSIAVHSPSKLLLTFAQPFAKDTHYVQIKNLFDIYGMEADTVQRTAFFTPIQQTHTFYLAKASVCGTIHPAD